MLLNESWKLSTPNTVQMLRILYLEMPYAAERNGKRQRADGAKRQGTKATGVGGLKLCHQKL